MQSLRPQRTAGSEGERAAPACPRGATGAEGSLPWAGTPARTLSIASITLGAGSTLGLEAEIQSGIICPDPWVNCCVYQECLVNDNEQMPCTYYIISHLKLSPVVYRCY